MAIREGYEINNINRLLENKYQNSDYKELEVENEYTEKLIEAEDVRFDEFKSYIINNGLEDLLKETGIESKASFEPVANKGRREVRKNNLEGLNATEIVDKFLHDNPKGTAATYKDFLKSDMYYDAASVVNMRNFNSAKARLKVAGKI